MRLAAALFTLGVLVSSAALAQTSPDSRWVPWLGCWQAESDGSSGFSRPGGQVCVAAEGSGVVMTTTTGAATPLTQRITADDVPRPIAEASCTGTEQSAWSDDGFRLYSRAVVTCGGDARRQVSGLSLLAPDGTWIEAQAIDIGGRSSVRVRRFTKDGGAPATPARGRLTIDQVRDASRHVAAPALEAALVEARATFGLTRTSLIALDESGVPPSVIDVMVALTYPQAFAIHPASRADRLTAFPFEADPLDAGGPWWPMFPAALGGYFNSAYFFSPFGYSAFGAYPTFFGVGDGSVGGGGDAPGNHPERAGRVVNGRGYTRLAPRGVDASSGASAAGTEGGRNGTGGGTVTNRGYTRSDGGSSGGGASSAGSSSGSAGSGGGRTAVDR